MLFWVIVLAMAALVAFILARAVLRGTDDPTIPADFDVQVYRDQLAEVDRDLERGTLGPDDAARVRVEISRRILAADSNQEAKRNHTRSRASGGVTVAVVAFALLAGSAGLYLQLGAPGYGDLALADRVAYAQDLRKNRPNQAEAESQLPAGTVNPEQGENSEYTELVKQLRKVVEARPEDVEGHRLLAISERNLGNFADARAAFEIYVNLRGTNATVADYSSLAEFMVAATGGYVSPEAEVVLATVLERDPGNGAARYFWGLMHSQTGRPDQAFRIWDGLLRQGPPEAPWIRPIQAQIDDMATLAGVNYAQPAPGGGRGPSVDDIEAAGEMSATDRMEMIEGMVAGLADRLSTDGGPASEWAQLISALGVLGRQDDALSIYRDALDVFGNDPGSLDIINRAGEQAGVAQ